MSEDSISSLIEAQSLTSLRKPASSMIPHNTLSLFSPLNSANRLTSPQVLGHLRSHIHGIRSSMALGINLFEGNIFRDTGVAIGSAALAYAWLQLWIYLTAADIVKPSLSRKMIHCTSAPLFMCTWPLYYGDTVSRLIAAIVPLIQIVRLVSAGMRDPTDDISSKFQYTRTNTDTRNPPFSHKIAYDDGLAATISRSGDKKEALGGPLIYAVGLFVGTVLFFRDSTVGVVALSQMAAGDGLADIVGRRLGKVKWPFSKNKSIAGSLAFVVGGFVASASILGLMHGTGNLPFASSSLSLAITPTNLYTELLLRLLVISVTCAAAELIPIGDDNVTVPVVGAVLSMILLEPLFSNNHHWFSFAIQRLQN